MHVRLVPGYVTHSCGEKRATIQQYYLETLGKKYMHDMFLKTNELNKHLLRR